MTEPSTNDTQAKAPRPPRGLQTAGRNLWKATVGRLDLDAHEHLLLLQACRVADTLDALATAAVGQPLTVTNARGDEVAQPLLVESRQQSIVLARLIASLRLPEDIDGEGELGGRPQRRGAARGAYRPRLEV